MTPPVQPVTDHEQVITALRQQGATDDDIESYLRQIGATQIGMDRTHQDFQSGALQRRNTILNRNDQGAAQEGNPSYMDRFGSMAERAASVLGGGKVMQGLRAWKTGEPWDEAGQHVAADVEEAGQNAPGVTVPPSWPLIGGSRITAADVPAAMAGGRALLRAGLGPTTAAATQAGGARAMSPAPEPIISRALGMLKSALVGAAIPAATEGIGLVRTAVDAARAPSFDANVVGREAARDAAATPLYDEFRSGDVLPKTPALQSLVEDVPIVRAAIARVKGRNSELTGLSDYDPKVLDAAYKNIGKQAATDQYDPSVTLHHLGDAIEEAGQAQGLSYRDPLDAFRVPSEEIDAVRRGNRAMQYSASPKGAPIGALEDSPAAFRQWASDPNRTSGELQGATEGILSRLQVEPKTARFGLGKMSMPTGPSQALREAPGLLGLTRGVGPLDRAVQLFKGDSSIPIQDIPQRFMDWRRGSPASGPPSALPAGSYAMGPVPEPSVAPTAAPTPSPRALPSGFYEMGGATEGPEAPLPRAEEPPARQWYEPSARPSTQNPSAISNALRAFQDQRAEAARVSEMTPMQRRALDMLQRVLPGAP